jgi:hypothetical protein
VLLVTFAFKGAAFFLAVPAVANAVDHRLGVPNLAALGIHVVGGIVFSAGILVVLLFWHYPAQQAKRLAFWVLVTGGLVSAAMISLWAADGIQARATHYLLQNGSRPLTGIYLVLYTSAVLVGLGLIARICWQQAKSTSLVCLRRGLQCTAAGALIYMVSPADRLLSARIAAPLGLNPLDWEILVPACTGTGILLIVAGLTMPSWGPQVAALRAWAADYRSYRELYPLWSTLCESVPEIALHPTTSPVKKLEYRLYRRVVEIRDAQLALRPHGDSAVAAMAARRGEKIGLRGDDLQAVVEAAQLKAALRSRNGGTTTAANSTSADRSTVRGGDGIADEIAWLRRVARAYFHSPVVAATARSTAPGGDDSKPQYEPVMDDGHDEPF